jgi:hypothetical protein
MNSGVPGTTHAVVQHARAPRPIMLAAGIYVALLLTAGAVLAATNADGWYDALALALLPAAVYAMGTLNYGHALFSSSDPIETRRAWLRLIQITALLYGGSVSWMLIEIILEWRRGEAGENLLPPILLVTAVLAMLLAGWAFALKRVILNPDRRSFGATIALTTGGAVILTSLALDVNWDTRGWEILTWQGAWPTNEFVQIEATRTGMRAVCLGGYATGLLLALLAIGTGTLCLAKRPPRRLTLKRVADLAMVVFWFATTNYLCSLWLESCIGVFNWTPKPIRYALIAALWIAELAGGLVLWFRFRQRRDARGRMICSALLLWALPMPALVLAGFLNAFSFGLFGLTLFISGVLIVTLCSWKLAYSGVSA